MLEISPKTRIAVVGLGKSGRSAIRFCQGLGAEVILSEGGNVDDITSAWLQKRGVSFESCGHSVEFLSRADLVLISPGVPHYLPILQEVRQKGILVVGELALAALYLRTPVIAITGTNGKTTVTTLLGNLLRAAGKKVFVGGNIGAPLTDYLAGPQDAHWLVLEISSFQLDAAGGFTPNIGLLLNISPDHLDRYEGVADYAQTKMRLFEGQGAGDIAIVNYDDEHCQRQDGVARKLGRKGPEVLWFGHDLEGRSGAWVQGQQVRLSDRDDSFDLSGTYLESSPNLENAAAAILAALAAGCSARAIQLGLADFRSLPHRMTFVTEIGGVRYVDDSKATNIGAVVAALASISGSVVLIAGGRDKGGDYGLLVESVRKKVTSMLLIGEARGQMAAVFGGVTNVELMVSLEEAVARAGAISRSGDTVLLSPACASFDMFASYAQRGEVFQQRVMMLNGGKKG